MRITEDKLVESNSPRTLPTDLQELQYLSTAVGLLRNRTV